VERLAGGPRPAARPARPGAADPSSAARRARGSRALGRERSAALDKVEKRFDLLTDLAQDLAAALEERPPVTLTEGGVIRRGYDAELDECRDLRDGGRQYIASLQQRER
jgi:DNA mismatch repair protein MutS